MDATTLDQKNHGLLDRLRAPNAPIIVHYLVLVCGFLFFSLVAVRSWFFYDDWYFLRASPNILWDPHVGHWNTVPVLFFQAIQWLFGMDHYLPFAIPAILVHLTVVHFLWRIALRSGVRPWIATAISVLVTLLGAGSEALVWAVQIGFVGAIAGMLGCILVLDTPRLTVRRGIAASALVLASLATSGVAFPFILVAVILAVIRHGLLRTAGLFSVPIFCWVIWFLLSGHSAASVGRANGIGQLLLVPQFAITMVTEGLGNLFPVTVLGSIIFVALAIWWLFTLHTSAFRSTDKKTLVPYLLFIAAPAFALLTGYSRIGLGLGTATSSRYVYVTVICIMPLMVLGLNRLTRSVSLIPVVVIVLIVAAWNLVPMATGFAERIHRTDSTRAQLAETAAVIRAYPGCLPAGLRPSPQWAPDATIDDLEAWIAHGWYNPKPVPTTTPGC